MNTLADYVVRAACSLMIAAFNWLAIAVCVKAVTGLRVIVSGAGVLALWLCVFAALELAGFWEGATDD